MRPKDVNEKIKMTYMRPYLIRSLYDWILDNNCTPHILVDATLEGLNIPEQFVKGGKIVLNVAPIAVQGLRLLNSHIEFNATFSGVPMHIFVPVIAVQAIYAKENGKGMVFAEEEDGVPHEPGEPSSSDASGRKKGGSGSAKGSHLKVVK